MTRSPVIHARRGAVLLESAIVCSVTFLLLVGLIVGGMGVFRYQQMAWLAREAARFACVHGSEFREEIGANSPTQQEIRDRVVLPLAAALNPDKLAVTVQWIDNITGSALDWDRSNKAVLGITRAGAPVTNSVRVTVSYQWAPEFLLRGPVTLRSTSEMPMAY